MRVYGLLATLALFIGLTGCGSADAGQEATSTVQAAQYATIQTADDGGVVTYQLRQMPVRSSVIVITWIGAWRSLDRRIVIGAKRRWSGLGSLAV